MFKYRSTIHLLHKRRRMFKKMFWATRDQYLSSQNLENLLQDLSDFSRLFSKTSIKSNVLWLNVKTIFDFRSLTQLIFTLFWLNLQVSCLLHKNCSNFDPQFTVVQMSTLRWSFCRVKFFYILNKAIFNNRKVCHFI